MAGKTIKIAKNATGVLDLNGVSVIDGYDPRRIKLAGPRNIISRFRYRLDVTDLLVFLDGQQCLRIKNALGMTVNFYAKENMNGQYWYYKVPSQATLPTGTGYGYNGTAIGASSSSFSGTVDGRLYAKVKNFDMRDSKKATTVYGNALANNIYASQGGSNIIGLGGNDTLVGGKGRDTFYFGTADGTDVVKNFNGSQDVIRLTSGKYTAAQFKSHVTLNKANGEVDITNGKTKVRIVDGIGQKITVYGADNKLIYSTALTDNKPSYNKKTGTVTLNKNYTGTMDLRSKSYAAASKIDASAATHNVTLYGNGKSNRIVASKGGSVMRGFGGNDTMVGGAGADKFYFGKGDGNLTIEKFDTSKDKIVFYDSNPTYNGSASTNNIWFTLGTGKTVTVRGGYNKWISVIHANGVENAYQVFNGGFAERNSKQITLKDTYKGKFSFKNAASKEAWNVNASRSRYATTIYGTAGNNIIQASQGGSQIISGNGNDRINCNVGQDVIYLNRKGSGNTDIYNLGKTDILYMQGVKDGKEIGASVKNGVLSLTFSNNMHAQVMGWNQNSSFGMVFGDNSNKKVHTVSMNGGKLQYTK